MKQLIEKGRHYGTLRKRKIFVYFEGLLHRKCFQNAAPGTVVEFY